MKTIWEIGLLLIGIITTTTLCEHKGGLLYPRQTETRETMSLDGIWNFRQNPSDNPALGFEEKWFSEDLKSKSEEGEVLMMPVPSSYNDITQDAGLRDHSGYVWYDRKFFVPARWENTYRVWLRFSSINYAAQVWINGKLAMNHEIGHLPFQSDIGNYLQYGKENRVTVACDNTLTTQTIPQGSIEHVKTDNGKRIHQRYDFDFFNYAGIQRPVTLYTTPVHYIDDIEVVSDILDEDRAVIYYNVTHESSIPTAVHVRLMEDDGTPVAKSNGAKGELEVKHPYLWWPYLMDANPGYLYTLEVQLLTEDNKELIDVYRLPVGIRTITWSNTSFLINGKPVYLQGFGRHEDSDLRGKGLDLVTVTKDYNLIKWVGGNAYRTSHYPYADEIMDFADRQGIMIIDECPSVDTDRFSTPLLEQHKSSLTDLIKRDKNRPSVIAWSIANEPRTQHVSSGPYFSSVAEHVKSLDITRPITAAIAVWPSQDHAGQYLDILSFNRYNGWYKNTGMLDTITTNIIDEATHWYEKYGKLVILSEYGADTVEGLHVQPEYVWTEEFQVQMMSNHFKAFDTLREKGWFIGEFIWNFADFKTAQDYKRVAGNKKGIFTRQRQPKAGAHHLRQRYHTLANELYNATLPDDLSPYVATYYTRHTEL